MLPKRSPKDSGVLKAAVPQVPARRTDPGEGQEGYFDRSREVKKPKRGTPAHYKRRSY
jgi:hypothetical protein